MDRAIAIDSGLLKERIYLVSHSGVVTDAVSYTAEEIEHILEITPEYLKVIHDTKKLFKGSRVIEEPLELKRLT